MLACQFLEPGLGQAPCYDNGGVDDEQSACGARSADGSDNIGHRVVLKSSTPAGGQREDGLRLGDFCQIGFLDHVLSADPGRSQPAGSDPTTHCFRVPFGAACRLGHC